MKPIIRALSFLWVSIAFEFRGLALFLLLAFSYAVLAIVDIYTWYFKNEKHLRLSRKLNLGITTRWIKLFFGVGFFFVMAHLSAMIPDGMLVPYVSIPVDAVVAAVPIFLFIGWILAEIKSIFENLEQMGETDPITRNIPSRIGMTFEFVAWLLTTVIGKLKDLGVTWLSDKFDAISRKWALIIEKKPDEVVTGADHILPKVVSDTIKEWPEPDMK